MNKFMDFLIIILFIVVISLLIYTVTIMKSDGVKCSRNPLTYGARELSKINKAEFSCSCTLNKINSPLIFFSNDTFDVRYPESNPNYKAYEFNFSKIN